MRRTTGFRTKAKVIRGGMDLVGSGVYKTHRIHKSVGSGIEASDPDSETGRPEKG